MRDGGARSRSGRVEASASLGAEVAQGSRTRLQELARRLGNDEISRRIGSGNATRDDMLGFVLKQLETVRNLQTREVEISTRQASYDWWQQAGNGVQPPDPTRWREPARTYEAAVDAICRGDLRRGQDLLEQALTAQERTTEATSPVVDRADTEAHPDLGELGRLVALTPTSGACAEPLPIRDLLGAIDRVATDPPQAPADRELPMRWWADEEEEEEADDEEDPDGAGGGGAA